MTLRSAILAAVTGETAQETDPYYNLVSLHLKGDVNTGRSYNAFSDASSNNFRLTNNGDVRGSSFSPYGTSWSAYFDNTNDYVSYNTSDANLAVGASDNFCVECWVYYDTAPNYEAWFQAEYRTGALTSNCLWFGYNSGSIVLGRHASSNFASAAITINQSQWYHLVGVRQAGNVAIFVNGTRVASASSNTMDATQNGFNIGNIYPNGYMGGYISNVRFIRAASGTSMPYDPTQTTISVPTSPLSAVTGTRVLACQGNRFLDASGNNYTLTVNDAPRISSFSPFLETDTTTGSGYFDGTGDYLTLGDNAAMELLNNNFTIEFWINTTTSAQYDCVIGRELTTPGTGMWSFQLNSGSVGSGDIAFWSWDYNSFSAPMMITSGVSLRDGAWHHVAVVRNGSAWAIYIDGVSRATQTSSITIGNIGLDYWIGNNQANTTRDFLGYLSNFRYVVGVAVYTGNFTPPAAPLTVTQSAGTNIAAIPEFVYATFDSGASSVTLSNGNLTLTGVGGSGYNKANTTTAVSSGKWYFEATLVSAATDTSIGISQGNSSSTYPGQEATSYAYVLEKGQKFNGNSAAGYAASLAAGDVFMCAFDLDNNKLFFGKNGSWFASSDPVTGANPAFTLSAGTYRAVGRPYSTNTVTFNFGASAFAYTPPTGFVGLRGPATQLLTLQERGAYNTIGFQDESEYQHVITRPSGANVAQGTFSPFSQTGWGNYFDGTGDYLTSTWSVIGSNQFTCEAWVYITEGSNRKYIVGPGIDTATHYDGFGFEIQGQTLNMWASSDGTSWNLVTSDTSQGRSANAVPLNSWNHVVMTRDSSGVFRSFINGKLECVVSPGTAALADASTTVLNLGRARYTGDFANFLGYISNFRIVNGSVVSGYSTSSTTVGTQIFTPPTSPLTEISGTSILTCQSNRFRDASSNNFTITPAGNTSVVAFSPFKPVAYDPAVHGGSAYFDGNLDYITSTNATAFVQGTGNFTAECWVYPVANGTTGSYGRPMIFGTVAGSQAGWSVLWEQPPYGAQSGLSTLGTESGGWASGSVTSAAGVAPIGAWTHVALVRNGANLTLYANGVSVATRSDAGSYNFPNGLNNEFRLGYFSDGSNTGSFNGYISNFRLVKGTAVYTSNFTPPSGPLPLLGNTSLLLNFTNGGVIDSTGKNVIETVGNAGVVTTTIKKYGSGSLFFDGTGDYLFAPPSQNFSFGTGDFTIEAWFYTAVGTNNAIFQISNTAGGFHTNYSNTIAIGLLSGKLNLFGVAGIGITSTGASYATSSWVHVALVRSSGVTKLYLNGTLDTTVGTSGSITDTTNYTMQYIIVGGYFSTSYLWNGYIDDLRITRGVARYTANFTVPTKAHPDRGTLSTLTVDMAAPSSVEYLVVAGGGGGAPSAASGVGSTRQAGAGAGGFRTGSSSVSSGVLYPLTIGAGGFGGTAGSWNPNTATNGSNSTFSSITSAGGGRGGTDAAGTSGNGGSGGGSSYPGRTRGLGNTPASSSPPDTNAVQGYDGADAPQGGGGGAGGAGQAGGNTTGGNGGIAASSSITGVQVYYAGGGGGGDFTGGVAGLGGGTSTASQKGGGGNGGLASNGVDGSPNTGGGGGGAAVNSGGTYKGGEGGSGVVILAYPTSFRPLKASLGLVYTIDTVTRPGYRVYKFTAGTGSISW